MIRERGSGKPAPVFMTEAEERAFRESHGSRRHVHRTGAERVRFADLEPSARAISLRLPVELPEPLRQAASQRDAPCRSPIEVRPAEKVGAA